MRVRRFVLAALTVVIAPSARAASAPDSLEMFDLRHACQVARMVQVNSVSGRTFLVRKPEVGIEGIEIKHPVDRPALLTMRGAEEPARTIPWNQVDAVYSARSRTGISAVTGLAIGAGAGALLVSLQGRDIGEAGDNGVVYFAGVLALGGGALGLLIGSTHPELHRLYP
jgi:hypothetical protein